MLNKKHYFFQFHCARLGEQDSLSSSESDPESIGETLLSPGNGRFLVIGVAGSPGRWILISATETAVFQGLLIGMGAEKVDNRLSYIHIE